MAFSWVGLICSAPKLRIRIGLLQKYLCWIIWINIPAFLKKKKKLAFSQINYINSQHNIHLRMSHHLIYRSVRCLQRIHARFRRHIGLLIITPHWSNQIEEKWNESSTAPFFEQDLKWMCRIKGSVLVIWDYLYPFYRIQVVVHTSQCIK